MNKKLYFMFVHGDDKNGFWGEFPDLPGCMTDGVSLEELMLNAANALESWIGAMIEREKSLPAASNAKMLKKKADKSETPVLFIVPVTGYMPSEPMRINITSTEDKIAEITTFARRIKCSRSELMVKATLDYIRANA